MIIVPRDYKGPSRDLRLANGRSWPGNQIYQSLEIETLIEEFHKEILNSSFTNTLTNASKQRDGPAW